MNKRKILALAMALSIVAIMAVGATLAYFTDTDEATNVFTVGNVEIKVDETDISATSSPAGRVQENTYENVVPGVAYSKDPMVTNIGTNDAYVRVKVHIENGFNWMPIVYGNFKLEDHFMDMVGELGDGWTVTDASFSVLSSGKYASDVVITLCYGEILGVGEETTKVFETIKLPENMTETHVKTFMTETGSFRIGVVGEAIQAEGFTSAEAAFAALDEALAE